jgi:hypothetical protein
MKINFKNALLILSVVLIMVECKKKNEEPPADPVTTPTTSGSTVNNLADLFAANGATVATNPVNATAAQTLNVSGVRLIIPANSFVTASNGTVTGTIDVSTKNVFTKSDIILSGAPANSQGKLVATKGCVKTSATQNGQVLRLAPGANVFTQIPEPDNMSVSYNLKKFYASKVSVSDSNLCWKAAPDTNNIPVVFDTLNNKYYYNVKLDSVNWLNAGYIFNPGGVTKTSVTITNSNSMFNNTNLAVYISFKAMNVVGSMYQISPGVFKINNIPVGQNVNIVAIAAVNNTYYSYFSPNITVTANHTDSINLQSTTITQIKTMLNSLP